MLVLYFSFIFLGLVLGGIMFSNIIPKLFIKNDISLISDDRNPGAYNAFKYGGRKIGLLCLVLDFFKGFIPIFLATFFVDYNSLLFSLIFIAPVCGHALGIFNHFHGGKCITTSFGVLMAIIRINFWPLFFLACLYIFFSLIIKIESNKTKSIVVYSNLIILTIALFAYDFNYIAIGIIIVAIIVIFKHLNISRRLNERMINLKNN